MHLRRTVANRPVGTLGRIICVFAHPDDETYLAGGLLAAAAENGQATACISATAGEHGTRDPRRWPPAELAQQRRAEMARALAMLGVGEHHWLGLEDGGCEAADDEVGLRRIGAIVERFRPDTVVTFGPDGVTGHRDHVTVGRWATEAARSRSGVDVLHVCKTTDWLAGFEHVHRGTTVFEPGHPWAVDPSQVSLDLTLDDRALDRKVAALRAFETQVPPVIHAFGAARWREWVRRETFAAGSAVAAALATLPAVA